MTTKLAGLRVAVLAADGVEQIELTDPRDALQTEGAQTIVIAPARAPIQGFHGDAAGESVQADLALDDAQADDFDALLLPGGRRSAERLRASPAAQALVRAMQAAGKPIAAICHGPWLLASAGLVRGRTLTSAPGIRSDIEQAGGRWVDGEAVRDANWVTSRGPRDLPAFNAQLKEMLRAYVCETVKGTEDERIGVGASS